MIISVWGEHINEIEEYQWYTLTDVNIKHFYGKKLTTNMETSIRKFETSLSIDSIDIQWDEVPQLARNRKTWDTVITSWKKKLNTDNSV